MSLKMMSQRSVMASGKFLTARSVVRAPAVRRVLTRAEPPTDGTSSTGGNIMYGGKSYTPTEWEDAVAKGVLKPNAPSSSQMSETAVTSPVLDNLVEVMAFSGPGPEIINGRLAMLGFVTAAAAELSSGESVFSQWKGAAGPIALTFGVFILASLVPFLRGSKGQAVGPFTAQAEMLNGRFAMIGFAALLLLETTRGAALL